jgi:endonuclease YncB( thermonuclease family)
VSLEDTSAIAHDGDVARHHLRALVATLLAAVVCPMLPAAASSSGTFRVDHVADGDTLTLRNGQRVRLVQIDTPEVYFGTECYGPQAAAITKRLLPSGTAVRLATEPATDSVDVYGRLLRYVIRARDNLNVNVYLVRIGAAAPYFYDHRLGRYASLLQQLALRARRLRLGLWGRCRHTAYNPYRGVATAG